MPEHNNGLFPLFQRISSRNANGLRIRPVEKRGELQNQHEPYEQLMCGIFLQRGFCLRIQINLRSLL
jgi:hypothetical protein